MKFTGLRQIRENKRPTECNRMVFIAKLLSAQNVSGTIKFHTGPATCKPKVCTSYFSAHALIRHFHTHTAIAQATSGLPGPQIPVDQTTPHPPKKPHSTTCDTPHTISTRSTRFKQTHKTPPTHDHIILRKHQYYQTYKLHFPSLQRHVQ